MKQLRSIYFVSVASPRHHYDHWPPSAPKVFDCRRISLVVWHFAIIFQICHSCKPYTSNQACSLVHLTFSRSRIFRLSSAISLWYFTHTIPPTVGRWQSKLSECVILQPAPAPLRSSRIQYLSPPPRWCRFNPSSSRLSRARHPTLINYNVWNQRSPKKKRYSTYLAHIVYLPNIYANTPPRR